VRRRAPAGRRSRPARAARRGARGEAGQASVELVALLPLALLVGLAIFGLLASRAASGQAAAAAQAGAMALIQDGDARREARAALPPAARRRATIEVRGRAITVTVRPRSQLGFLAGALSATSTANAGPEPR
jgi:pilus assembly protein CpaE